MVSQSTVNPGEQHGCGLPALPRPSRETHCCRAPVHGTGTQATHLGEPEKILHEQAGVGVINLHHGDLVFMGHQDVVILVEDGCQVEAPARERRQTSVSLPAASFVSQSLSPEVREDALPQVSAPLQQPVAEEAHSQCAGAGTQCCQQGESGRCHGWCPGQHKGGW